MALLHNFTSAFADQQTDFWSNPIFLFFAGTGVVAGVLLFFLYVILILIGLFLLIKLLKAGTILCDKTTTYVEKKTERL